MAFQVEVQQHANRHQPEKAKTLCEEGLPPRSMARDLGMVLQVDLVVCNMALLEVVVRIAWAWSWFVTICGNSDVSRVVAEMRLERRGSHPGRCSLRLEGEVAVRIEGKTEGEEMSVLPVP